MAVVLRDSCPNLAPFTRFQVDTSTSGCHSVSGCEGSHERILQPKLSDLLQLQEKRRQRQTARRQDRGAAQRAAVHLQRLLKLLHCESRLESVLKHLRFIRIYFSS